MKKRIKAVDQPSPCPLKKQRKKAGKKRIASSFQVFMSFVRREVDYPPSVEWVFSKDCFKLWISTRGNELKHPEQAFHRTLLAHVRGKDTRKPFPPDVEQELLRYLRHNDKQMWENCFGENKFNVGRQRFKHLGYHEKRRDTDSTHGDESDDPKMIKKPYITGTELQEYVTDDSQKDSFSTCLSLVAENDVNTSFLHHHLDPFLSSTHRVTETNPWNDFVKVMSIYFRQAVFDQLCIEAKKLGITVFSPALVYLLKQQPSKDDMRFKLDFLFPTEVESRFLEDRPVGCMLVARSNWMIIDCCDTSRSLLRSTLLNTCSLVYHASMLEMWFSMTTYLPKLKQQGYIWKRQLFRKGDGTKGIFMLRHQPLASAVMQVEFQDISDLHPECLNIPYFI